MIGLQVSAEGAKALHIAVVVAQNFQAKGP
jgi:hypothetical protein